MYVQKNCTKQKCMRLLLMPKRPFNANNKLIEVTYLFQLEIGHLLRQFSEEQEPRIDYNSSLESFNTAQASNIIIPSSILFVFDFDINKIKTLTTKKKTTVGNDTEMVEIKLPLTGPSCTKFQLIYCVTKFQHASNTLQWTTGPKLSKKWKHILEDAWCATICSVYLLLCICSSRLFCVLNDILLVKYYDGPQFVL